jgi:hypothetical protein
MKFTKTQIISAFIGAGAFLDTMFQLVTDNVSLLIEAGIEPKIVSIVRLVGLIIGIFSTSLLRDKKEVK